MSSVISASTAVARLRKNLLAVVTEDNGTLLHDL